LGKWEDVLGGFAVGCVVGALATIFLYSNHSMVYTPRIKRDLVIKKHAVWVTNSKGKPTWKMIEVAPKEK
jgi:hypothetical protein